MNFSAMFSTIDAHVAGEAFRILVHSPLLLNEDTLKENNDKLHDRYQDECAFLLNEPRGHRGMHGCIVVPSEQADLGILFFDHLRSDFFSYSGLIAAITVLLETGNLQRTETDRYTFETIHGFYIVRAAYQHEQVTSVVVENREVRLLEQQTKRQLVEVDAARRYLIIPSTEVIPRIELAELPAIRKWGKSVLETYRNAYPSLSGIIVVEHEDNNDDEVRSITLELDGNIVRSPGVDSTFAILAALKERNEKYSKLTNRSIFDSSLTACVVDGTSYHFYISAQGFTTGEHKFIYDNDDPLENGFLLK